MAETHYNQISDVVDPQFCEDYQNKVTHLRFLGQLNSVLSGATFFAVLSIIGNSLITLPKVAAIAGAGTVATGTAASYATVTGLGFIDAALPALALVNWPLAISLVAVGLTCAYLSTSYFQRAGILDSDFNARNIAAATNKTKNAPETQVAVAIAQDVKKEKPQTVPGITTNDRAAMADGGFAHTANDHDAVPQSSITNERSLADTIVARGAANENAPAEKAAGSWEDKMIAADETQPAKARG